MKKTVPPNLQKRERGASKKRIGLYWKRWLCWATICVMPAAGLCVTEGTTCADATDRSSRISGGGDIVASHLLLVSGNCTALDFDRFSPSGSVPVLGIFLNSFHSGPPLFLNTFTILYRSSVTDLKVNSVSRASGVQQLVSTADDFTAVISYTFGGEALTFTATKAAGTDTLGRFTVSAAEPEIDLQRPASTSIADAGTDAQGDKSAGTAVTVTYTVANTGTAQLDITNIQTANLSNVSIGTISTTSFNVAASGTATFDVTYTPTASGTFSFDLKIINNDADEGDYDISVSGTVPAPVVVSAQNIPSLSTWGIILLIFTLGLLGRRRIW